MQWFLLLRRFLLIFEGSGYICMREREAHQQQMVFIDYEELEIFLFISSTWISSPKPYGAIKVKNRSSQREMQDLAKIIFIGIFFSICFTEQWTLQIFIILFQDFSHLPLFSTAAAPALLAKRPPKNCKAIVCFAPKWDQIFELVAHDLWNSYAMSLQIRISNVRFFKVRNSS